MKEQIEAITIDIKRIQTELRSNRKQLSALSAKGDELKGKLPSLDFDIRNAEDKKKRILDLSVTGETSKKDADEAREKITAAVKAKDEAHEILEAISRRKGQTQTDYEYLKGQLDEAKKKLWQNLYEEIKTELSSNSDLRDKIKQAWVAKTLEVGGGDFAFILVDLVGGRPETEEHTQISEMLSKKYVGEEHGIR